jgi:hypothetical protein
MIKRANNLGKVVAEESNESTEDCAPDVEEIEETKAELEPVVA